MIVWILLTCIMTYNYSVTLISLISYYWIEEIKKDCREGSNDWIFHNNLSIFVSRNFFFGLVGVCILYQVYELYKYAKSNGHKLRLLIEEMYKKAFPL